jgi:hypothetical protein
MAFNPFHHFRKYSKVVFAILAIICMFTFVLSSGMGRGDWFTQMTDWATGRRSIPVYVTLYGKEYDARQVVEVQRQRQLANDYMEAVLSAASNNLTNRVNAGLSKLDPETANTVMTLLRTRSQYLGAGLYEFYVSSVLQTAFFRIQMLLEQAESQKKTDAVGTLAALRGLLSLDAVRLAGRRPGESFFGGAIGKLDDTVDFLLWQHVADELGIRLSNPDIDREVANESLGEYKAADAALVLQGLRERYRGFSDDALYAALGDELRARIAQVALVGSASGGTTRTRTAVPVALTPEESWELFKDARTTVRVGLIALPVASFLPQVTATPTEEELKKLFDKYKNQEPRPDSDQPGFREPRHIQVEWLAASPDLPFYQKAAARLEPVLPWLRLLGHVEHAALPAAPLAVDAEVLHQEIDYRQRELPWTDNLTPRLHTTSVVRPENVALLVGAAMGGAAGHGTVLAGPLALEGRAIVREVRDRAKLGGSLILTGALDPSPLGVAGLPTEVVPQLPLAVLRSDLRDKARAELARRLVESDLLAFRAEVVRLGREKDRAAVQKYIADFVAQRGLERGSTTEPRDQYNLIDDPGLAPLKQAYQRGHGSRDLLLRGFAPEFFADQSMPGETDSLFIPHRFFAGQSEERQYYWWRTEDTPARTPRFDKARSQVVEAWKLLQARDLAQKEADRLAGLAKQAQGDAAKLRDLAAQAGGREFFELGPFAKFMPQVSPFGGQGRQYQTIADLSSPEQIAQVYRIPADRIAYPNRDLVDKLLALREQPKGATAVVTDQPKTHFFAAALLDRSEPSQDDFRRAYVGSMARATEFDSLLARLSLDRRERFRKDVLRQFRDEGKVVVNEEARKRGDESRGES